MAGKSAKSAKPIKTGANRGTKAGPGLASYAPGAEHLSHLEGILELMGRHQIAELKIEDGDQKLHLRAKGTSPSDGAFAGLHVAPVHAAYPPPRAEAHAPAASVSAAEAKLAEAAKAGAPATNHKQVLSPFVGTFYRAASPSSEPYCREGQVVRRGDVLCIIEAMKLMNEIEAEFPGKLITILVENGQPVEFGEPLFLIET